MFPHSMIQVSRALLPLAHAATTEAGGAAAPTTVPPSAHSALAVISNVSLAQHPGLSQPRSQHFSTTAPVYADYTVLTPSSEDGALYLYAGSVSGDPLAVDSI